MILSEEHVVALIQKLGPVIIKEQLGLLGHPESDKRSGINEAQNYLNTSNNFKV